MLPCLRQRRYVLKPRVVRRGGLPWVPMVRQDNPGGVGPAPTPPLAAVAVAADQEVARAAKRALWRIVRHAGRPGADAERQSVAVHVSSLLAGDKPAAVRREAP